MGIDPGSLALISTIASAVGTGVSFISGMSQASAAAKQAEYNAAVARNNQQLALNAASEAEQAGRVREANARRSTEQLKGRQRAVLAANGVDVNQGSALNIQEDTGALGEIDALNIRSEAERQAIGYKNQGANFGGEAALAAARAQNATTAGYFGGAGTILSGVGSVAQKWYNYKKNEVGGF